MPPLRFVALLIALLAAAAAVEEVPPSDDTLWASLLGPALEATMARALTRWQPPLLAELTRLHERLDMLQSQLGALQNTSSREARQLQCSLCERNPEPLPAGAGPYPQPEVLACARSCRQLRDQGGEHADGVYWFTGMSVPVFCDFSHDGGGWTLLLSVASKDGWSPLTTLSRSSRSPSIEDNYSILQHADAIRDLGTFHSFSYRIEAQVETGRQHWGGVWSAPRHFSFTAQTPDQTDVTLVTRFSDWEYQDNGIEQRMPWVNPGAGSALLTTSLSPSKEWWGTLVTRETVTGFKPNPWIYEKARNSGKVLYWVRE